MMMKKKPENLLKNLQNFSQKVTVSPTTLMPNPLLQRTLQGKDKESLHGWIIALEAPPPTTFTRFQYSTLKKSKDILTISKNPRMQKPSTDQEISQGVKSGKGKESGGTESVLFNFGDAYCDGVNWISVERTLYMENFKTIRSFPAFVDGLSSIAAIEDIKYSRDDVFKLSSQEETMKEFFREKIF